MVVAREPEARTEDASAARAYDIRLFLENGPAPRAARSPWPCGETESFARGWNAAVSELAQQGLVAGREAFGGWDDDDRGRARAAWCLVRHRSPRRASG